MEIVFTIDDSIDAYNELSATGNMRGLRIRPVVISLTEHQIDQLNLKRGESIQSVNLLLTQTK